MKPADSPFPTAWLSFELPGHRTCDGTYCFFPYEELPPLDETLLRGEFQWLTGATPAQQAIIDIHRQTPPEQASRALGVLLASAQRLRLTLPPAFVKFMSAPALQDQIPSCTACYFDLSEQILSSPAEDGGYLIRFLNDQQGVLFWYLYLTATGQEGVLVSSIAFDSESLAGVSREAILRSTGFCAESFEAFLYRFWLENTLWFALSEGQALTEAHQRYLQYRQSV